MKVMQKEGVFYELSKLRDSNDLCKSSYLCFSRNSGGISFLTYCSQYFRLVLITIHGGRPEVVGTLPGYVAGGLVIKEDLHNLVKSCSSGI